MNCLWCDADIIPAITWKTILQPPESKNLCPPCEEQLQVIRGNRCRKCSRESEEKLCSDCRWRERNEGESSLAWNYSVFPYNERMQEMVSKWKYRGDYAIGNAFKRDYLKAFNHIAPSLPNDPAVVPIPLSEERIKERGFNQSRMLAQFLPIEMVELLKRTHSEKQSKRTRRQRLAAGNPFFINQTVNKPVILADDIYTTGTTLHHAASILKMHGCPAVFALTLVRG
ncbi:competence protein ComFC [Lentibacillus persicus]|uniref:Competence protein ComFC n=1 Tax=Lentibacillus persicus TaxID=640948 RepID=A0A1I1WP72_9BACI|nr:ComF family protein [Lentibacillus persicus]SFD96977.1 competence protein ComFC [Lentibacillus persicus]